MDLPILINIVVVMLLDLTFLDILIVIMVQETYGKLILQVRLPVVIVPIVDLMLQLVGLPHQKQDVIYLQCLV